MRRNGYQLYSEQLMVAVKVWTVLHYRAGATPMEMPVCRGSYKGGQSFPAMFFNQKLTLLSLAEAFALLLQITMDLRSMAPSSLASNPFARATRHF